MEVFTRRSGVVARPVLRRARTWRGVMQVRDDTDKLTRREQLSVIFLRAPMHMLIKVILTLVMSYAVLGHDRFVHMLYGYESEMAYEGRVNPTLSPYTVGSTILPASVVDTPLRALERPLHPRPALDLFRDTNK